MIDLHSDTIYALWEKDDNQTLLSNSLSISKDRLIGGNVTGQCFALFTTMNSDVPENHKGKSPWQIVNELHDRFVRELKNAAITQYTGIEDLTTGLHAILTTEEGGAIEGQLERLETLASWDVKIFGLTWNWENELGFPNSRDSEVMKRGLKTKGIEAIGECERLGVIIDVSHLNEGGFYDVAKYSKAPFIATHSNARALTDHPRNLTDNQIKSIANHGGIIGLNICPQFLAFPDTPKGESRVEDMVRHTMHIYNMGGEDVLAYGSDFDGTFGNLEIDNPEKNYLLRDALLKAGLTSRVIDKMYLYNPIRIFKH